MEAKYSSGTPVDPEQTTRLQIPEERTLIRMHHNLGTWTSVEDKNRI
jgi:hypothetical protein